MVDIIKNIITNVLTALYQPFGFSVLLAVLFMFLYLYAMEYGWKESWLKWWRAFRTDVTFRRTFFLAFYTANPFKQQTVIANVVLKCTYIHVRIKLL